MTIFRNIVETSWYDMVEGTGIHPVKNTHMYKHKHTHTYTGTPNYLLVAKSGFNCGCLDTSSISFYSS